MIVVGNQEQAQSSTPIVIEELKILLFRSNDTLFHGELYKKNYITLDFQCPDLQMYKRICLFCLLEC